jgi:hypothetical protein
MEREEEDYLRQYEVLCATFIFFTTEVLSNNQWSQRRFHFRISHVSTVNYYYYYYSQYLLYAGYLHLYS